VETDQPMYWWRQLTEAPPERPGSTGPLENAEPDVVVVGAGAAGYAAAISAAADGASVVMLEAAMGTGGTTYKSGGGYWVPNNSYMRAAGLTDDKDEALRYMARLSFPEKFDPEQPELGLDRLDYALLDTYYDKGAGVIDELQRLGALRSCLFRSFTEEHPGMVGYHSDQVQEWGRALAPEGEDGGQQIGASLIIQLDAGARQQGVEVLTEHRVTGLIVEDGKVCGVEAETPSGSLSLRARQGVVFTSGGFSHDHGLLEEHFQGPIYGTCAVPTNRGDFIRIAGEVGAELGNLKNGWLAEVAVEAGLENHEQETVFMPSGDSMVYVDSRGVRVLNEKAMYQERAGVHFAKDADGGFPNQVLFMIFDEPVAKDPRPWANPWPAGCADEPYVIKADSLDNLARLLDERLDRLGEAVGGIRLAADFGAKLEQTVESFNKSAEKGEDPDFGRGAALHEIDWNRRAREGNDANPTMFPIASSGPYYAIIMGAGTLDTNGGPRIDVDGRVLGADRKPIAGLFGAGNCIASPTAGAYWSGGSTLGPALAFGYLAGKSAIES